MREYLLNGRNPFTSISIAKGYAAVPVKIVINLTHARHMNILSELSITIVRHHLTVLKIKNVKIEFLMIFVLTS